MSTTTSEHSRERLRLVSAPQTIRGKHGRTYEVVRELEPGGMADTYLVRRRAAGRTTYLYCLKRMRSSRRDEDKAKAFLDEAYVTSLLRHRNIVRSVDADVDESGRYFLCMEYVDGVDLEKLIDYYQAAGECVPTALATYIIREVLCALEYAHELEDDEGPLHIVHRDVTPSNILLSRRGDVQLTDFGIARFRARRSYTSTGHVKGKVAYMSPEHFNPSLGLDARSDLYSLGATWFEMLTGGVQPYGSRHDYDSVRDALYEGRLNPLAEYAPEVEPEVRELVLSLLRIDKNERPQSARAVREALRQLPRSHDEEEVLAREVEACLSAKDRPSDEEEGTFDGVLGEAKDVLRPLEGREPRGNARRAENSNGVVRSPARLRSVERSSGRPWARRTWDALTRRRRTIVFAASPVVAALAVITIALSGSGGQKERVPEGLKEDVAASKYHQQVAAAEPAPTAVPAVAAAQKSAQPVADPKPGTEPARVATPAATDKVEPAPAKRPRAAVKPGALVIYVRAPKAAVWVNGVLRKFERPLRIENLRPGRYRIEASEDEVVPPRVRTDALVTSGNAVEVTLTLPGPF